jgi:hypothetical protein
MRDSTTGRTTFHQFFWPAWHLTVDGKDISTQPDSLGRATALLPSPSLHHWELRRSAAEEAGLFASSMTLLVLSVWGISTIVHPRSRSIGLLE